MLIILVSHGEVVMVLDETETPQPDNPQPKRLKPGVDYKVEYDDAE